MFRLLENIYIKQKNNYYKKALQIAGLLVISKVPEQPHFLVWEAFAAVVVVVVFAVAVSGHRAFADRRAFEAASAEVAGFAHFVVRPG